VPSPNASKIIGRLIKHRDQQPKDDPKFHLLNGLIGLIRTWVEEGNYSQQLMQVQGMRWHIDELKKNGLDVSGEFKNVA
jgi:hypothetical protein